MNTQSSKKNRLKAVFELAPYVLIPYPFSYKEVGITRFSIVSLGRKNQVFPIVRENRKCIKSPVACDFGQAGSIQIDPEKIEREAAVCLMIGCENDFFS